MLLKSDLIDETADANKFSVHERKPWLIAHSGFYFFNCWLNIILFNSLYFIIRQICNISRYDKMKFL